VNTRQIIEEYLHFESAKNIASKHSLHPDDVKLILRNALSPSFYLKVARTIGARVVSSRLKDPVFRGKYSKKMSVAVRLALRNKMRNNQFKSQWKKKAKSASRKGNRKIIDLLKQPHFSAAWSKKCSFGACVLKNRGKGIFDPRLKNKRKIWSLKGLRHTGKKCKGPLGEPMYNGLEVEVAKRLLGAGVTYSYAKIVQAENLNGFFSVDFLVTEPPMIIEATYWDKPEQKSKELERKFISLRSRFPHYLFVVVSRASMYEHYKWLLPDTVTVLTPNQLEQFIARLNLQAKRGNKFS
jgi:hypothetical protein